MTASATPATLLSGSSRRRRDRVALAVGALALLATAAACEQNEDGSYSVDQAYLCVRPGDGHIRWAPNKDCSGDEVLIRVDEPDPADPGPQAQSWAGEVAMGATTPAVSADGAARSVVQVSAEETAQLGPNARCDLAIQGATVRVLGDLWTWGISDVVNATIDWADPGAANTVAMSCVGSSGFTSPIDLSVSLIPVG